MPEQLMIGYLVIALGTLVTLFFAIHKPLNDNTRAMTELTVKMEQFTEQLAKHEKELKEYKEHVSESQKRQWDAINEHTGKINELTHDLEMCQKTNKGGC